jgi:hypothetical protein
MDLSWRDEVDEIHEYILERLSGMLPIDVAAVTDAEGVHTYISERLEKENAKRDLDPGVTCDKCGLDTTAKAGFLFRLNQRKALVLCPRCYARRGHG